MNAIKVNKLKKKFDDFTAVDEISFEVKKGELFGLLGPNGAGKTTTINILSTLLSQTSGEAFISGFNVSVDKDNVRKSIGLVFQDSALDVKLTGRENLYFHAVMYDVEKNTINEKIDEVLELVDLNDKADVLVEKYSGGMKRRLEIARGFLHKPEVLFLDEPTLGLDAQTRRHIWEYVKKLNIENNMTIILTTHYMEEADFLCNRIAIMDNGKIIALDTPVELKNLLGGDIVSLCVEEDDDFLIKELENIDWIKEIKKKEDGSLNFTMERGEVHIPDIISIAIQKNIKINSVNLHKPSLEDVFIHFTGKSIREQESNFMDHRKEHFRMRSRRG